MAWGESYPLWAWTALVAAPITYLLGTTGRAIAWRGDQRGTHVCLAAGVIALVGLSPLLRVLISRVVRTAKRSLASGAPPELLELAQVLARRLDGSAAHLEVTAHVQGRSARITVVPGLVGTFRYAIELSVPAGAPRGRVVDEVELARLLGTPPAWLVPLARSVRESYGTWDGLVRIHGLRDIELRNRLLVARAPGRSGVLSIPEEAERVARILSRLAAVSEHEPTALDLRARTGRNDRCPYCHDGLAPDEPDVRECGGCGTRHHRECWGELGRCAVFACAQGTPSRAGPRVAAPEKG